jgi:hypothetical protein
LNENILDRHRWFLCFRRKRVDTRLAAGAVRALTWVKAVPNSLSYEAWSDGRFHRIGCHLLAKEERIMAEAASKLQVKQEGKSVPATARTASLWQPFESLRQEMDRVFEDFTRGFGRFPLSRSLFDVEPMLRYESAAGLSAPAVDVVEKESEAQITAELPAGREGHRRERRR